MLADRLAVHTLAVLAEVCRLDDVNGDFGNDSPSPRSQPFLQASFGLLKRCAQITKVRMTSQPAPSRVTHDHDLASTVNSCQQANRVQLEPRSHHQVHRLAPIDARIYQCINRGIALVTNDRRKIVIINPAGRHLEHQLFSPFSPRRSKPYRRIRPHLFDQ